MCVVSDSQAQARQRLAIGRRRGIHGGDVAGSRSRRAACARRSKLKQQWSSSDARRRREECASEKACDSISPQQRMTRKSTLPADMLCSELGVVSVASDVVECISTVQEGGTSILAIAIYNGYLNDRDEQMQETAGAPIRVSKCDPGRWIGAAIVPTKSANECASADLKTDVSGTRFAEVVVKSENKPAVLDLAESTAGTFKLAGVTLKTEESALCESPSKGLAESAMKDSKDAVRTGIGLSRAAFRTEFAGGHPVFPRHVQFLADGEKMQERSRWHASFARVADPLHETWCHEGRGESGAEMGRRSLPWCF